MNLTPSQLQTIRETGSVRVVVPMEPQPDELVFGVPCSYDYENEKLITLRNPLPSPGTIETIDGMECEWVERGCEEMTKPVILADGSRISAAYAGWHWTATLRRKDEGYKGTAIDGVQVQYKEQP